MGCAVSAQIDATMFRCRSSGSGSATTNHHRRGLSCAPPFFITLAARRFENKTTWSRIGIQSLNSAPKLERPSMVFDWSIAGAALPTVFVAAPVRFLSISLPVSTFVSQCSTPRFGAVVAGIGPSTKARDFEPLRNVDPGEQYQPDIRNRGLLIRVMRACPP